MEGLIWEEAGVGVGLAAAVGVVEVVSSGLLRQHFCV